MRKLKSFLHLLLIKFSKKFSRKNLYELLDESIDKYCQNKEKIINLGAGGDIKKALEKKNIQFKEVDIDEKRKPDYVCDIQNMNVFKDESIDIFVCMEVLEHIGNPFNAVSEIYRTLKKGGVIIGSTPFVFPIHEEPYDYFRYTKYGLQNLFNKFECLQLIERNSYLESAFVLPLRLINIGTSKQLKIAFLVYPLFILISPIILLLSLIIKNKQSTTGYFFVFKK